MCYARRQRSSWARIKLSKILYHFTFRCNNLFSSFCSSFTFVWVVFLLNLNCSSILRTFLCLLCTYLFVVQFSMTVWLSSRLVFRLRSRGDLSIISHCFPFVNTFLKLFSSFFKLFLSPSVSSLLGDSLYILPPFFIFVKGFLKSFLKFFFNGLFCQIS